MTLSEAKPEVKITERPRLTEETFWSLLDENQRAFLQGHQTGDTIISHLLYRFANIEDLLKITFLPNEQANTLWYDDMGNVLATFWDRRVAESWGLKDPMWNAFGDITLAVAVGKTSPTTPVVDNVMSAVAVVDAVGDTLRVMSAIKNAKGEVSSIQTVAQKVLKDEEHRTWFLEELSKRLVINEGFSYSLFTHRTAEGAKVINPVVNVTIGKNTLTGTATSVERELRQRLVNNQITINEYRRGIQQIKSKLGQVTETLPTTGVIGFPQTERSAQRLFTTPSSNIAEAVYSTVYLASRLDEFGSPLGAQAVLADVSTHLFAPEVAKTRNFSFGVIAPRTRDVVVTNGQLLHMVMDTYMGNAIIPLLLRLFSRDANKVLQPNAPIFDALKAVLATQFGIELDWKDGKALVNTLKSPDPQIDEVWRTRRSYLFGTGETATQTAKDVAEMLGAFSKHGKGITTKLASVFRGSRGELYPLKEWLETAYKLASLFDVGNVVKLSFMPVEGDATIANILHQPTAEWTIDTDALKSILKGAKSKMPFGNLNDAVIRNIIQAIDKVTDGGKERFSFSKMRLPTFRLDDNLPAGVVFKVGEQNFTPQRIYSIITSALKMKMTPLLNTQMSALLYEMFHNEDVMVTLKDNTLGKTIDEIVKEETMRKTAQATYPEDIEAGKQRMGGQAMAWCNIRLSTQLLTRGLLSQTRGWVSGG